MSIDDDFWAPRREQIRTRTLRQQLRQLRRPGQQLDALRLGWRPGDPDEPHIFWESDVAKWIEAASYCLATTDDPELGVAVDEAIELLAGAQQSDGYLNVYFTVVRPGQRFTDLRDAHELYGAGHLIEAGVAHHEATGKTRLLEVVRRYADLLVSTFGPGGACEGGYDGHEEIELALIKLYRATGDDRYLDLSRKMIADRGTQPFFFEAEEQRRGSRGYFGDQFPERVDLIERFRQYTQSHLPVTEQHEIVGHSVRAMYLCSAVTDLAVLDGDDGLARAADRLWTSLTERKLYVTGGLGSDPSIEGFGPDYDLPDASGYAETCAAIGLVQWAQRMNALTGDGRYLDTLERALYNGVLSGASYDGTEYFYGNPLASVGDAHRDAWFGVACCPPNLARLISELSRYVYAEGDRRAVVNLFVAGRARFEFGSTALLVEQQTRYPREGRVRIVVTPAGEPAELTLSVRVPGWSTPTVSLNGDVVRAETERGYLNLTRSWHAGDTLELDLGLTARRVWAHPEVTAASGKVALERGPVVFCLEGVDHEDPVRHLVLPREAEIGTRIDDRTGVVTLHATGLADRVVDGLYRSTPPQSRPVELTAVPYFSWANRGQSDMTVWIREQV
ncbi:MAG TPA: beta-L-arabinofuranosidase domain-containing protein [Propionibacteriaceae bacterium]